MCTKLHQSRNVPFPSSHASTFFSVILSFFPQFNVILLDLCLSYLSSYFLILPPLLIIICIPFMHFPLLSPFGLSCSSSFLINFCNSSSHYLCLTRLHCTLLVSALSILLTPLFSALNFSLFICLYVCLSVSHVF